MTDIHRYTIENVRRQAAASTPVLGAYVLRFYAAAGRPSRVPTAEMRDFWYYPSGGTIRDEDLNILFYEPRLDLYHISVLDEGARGEDRGRE